uniref:No apical meristem-associated C-terminal domain-containing protein n=1 Tax=Brassica oleracea TaxID=3712 RepID=A0A3P6EZ82_BRAOL|nr:unnamed protein product [Brassica oleracea]
MFSHEIFFNNHHKKFTLDHAWKELRNDQKWYAREALRGGSVTRPHNHQPLKLQKPILIKQLLVPRV